MGIWGGARIGAGRKPKEDAAKWLEGDGGKRKPRRARPKPVEVVLLPAPSDITKAEAVVWNELAPHACVAGTLVDGTAGGFKLLCKWVAIERALSRNREERGGTKHRGAMQRVEAGMLRYRLLPMGKPMVEAPVEPEDPFGEFDQPGGVQ